MKQYYDTTIYDEESGAAFGCIVIPDRNFSRHEDRQEFIASLDLENPYRHSISQDDVIRNLIELLSEDGSDGGQVYLAKPPPIVALMFRAVIPFENSPLAGVSLAELVYKGQHALGATIGFYMAHGNPLLMALCIPGGIILCGAANGVAAGLQHGLQAKIERWLNPKGKPAAKPVPEAPSTGIASVSETATVANVTGPGTTPKPAKAKAKASKKLKK